MPLEVGQIVRLGHSRIERIATYTRSFVAILSMLTVRVVDLEYS